MTRPPPPALLSVVVPCYNEEPCIEETHRRLVAVLAAIPALDFELVYVDDGSRDATLDLLRGLGRRDARVRVLALSRNFGQQVASSAGLEHAAGDAVVIMDADLRDPPEVIPDLLDRWRSGVEVAYGVRAGREGETAFKRWSARAFYRVLNRLAEISMPLDAGDFRLLDRKVVDAVLAMPERSRFLRGMVWWTGFRREPVFYRRAARAAGETRYPLHRMVRLALDGVLSFSRAPLRLATWLGVAVTAAALAGGASAAALGLFTEVRAPGWTLLLIAILFLGGAQLLMIGVLGEYLGRIYGEVQQRPLYLVRERLGFARRAGDGENGAAHREESPDSSRRPDHGPRPTGSS